MKSEIHDRTKDSKEMVFPGTRLAVTEEFLGGPGTYSTENYIFASVAGHVVINLERHEISVMPKAKMTPVPKVGDIFIGGVVNLSRQMATISVNVINNVEDVAWQGIRKK